mgnify:CR=1 FL=1
MSMTDPIADFLTRIRNAQMANHKMVVIPSSKLKRAITEILYDQGYILKYKFDTNESNQSVIRIALKYDSNNVPVIRKLQRVSKPGLRQYKRANELPRVINGLGVALISTSKGVMTDKQARAPTVGGEVLCYVY